MNLETAKAVREEIVDSDWPEMVEAVDWLIAEVSRLHTKIEELEYGKRNRRNHDRVQITTRSAEIADSSCGCKLDDDRCCAPVIVAAIRKEYKL